jgi:type I restriction enzyme M protein
LGLDTSGKEKKAIVQRILGSVDQKELAPRSPVAAGALGRHAATMPAKRNGGDLGFEDKLWKAADEAAEYKHVILGLIFLKYVSDAFADRHRQLEAEASEGADPEDADEYRAQNVFWVLKEARWQRLQSQAKQPTIGRLVDDAMVAIELKKSTVLSAHFRRHRAGQGG